MSTETPRRTRSSRYPGVYYRDGKTGRRYEISFSDSDGRRRWKVVDGGEKEALAALDDVRTRKRKGERVAPTRVTLGEVWKPWLDAQAQLRPRTRERYDVAFRCQIVPRLGRLRVSEITEDHVAALIAAMRKGLTIDRDDRGRLVERARTRRVHDEQGRLVDKELGAFSGWTIRATLTPLSRLMASCVRRGMAAANPVARLERGERPTVGRREMRILERDELDRLLKAAPALYRTTIATGAFTGLRLGELLGLTWADVDFENGLVRVRKQLARDGTRVEPKTPQAIRAVVMMPALGRLLRQHKEEAFAHGRAHPQDLVFASSAGTPMHARNLARRGLEKAMEAAGLNEPGKPSLRMHDLRHTFASLLIAQGADVVFVSRQLGHANPSITLSVYAHLFDRAQHAERTSALLEAAFGTIVETATGDQRLSAADSDAAQHPGNVVPMPGLAASGD